MIRKGTLECPMCGHGMRAWFQTGVRTVLCPVCQAEVDTANVRLEPVQPTRTGRVDAGPGIDMGLAGRV